MISVSSRCTVSTGRMRGEEKNNEIVVFQTKAAFCQLRQQQQRQQHRPKATTTCRSTSVGGRSSGSSSGWPPSPPSAILHSRQEFIWLLCMSTGTYNNAVPASSFSNKLGTGTYLCCRERYINRLKRFEICWRKKIFYTHKYVQTRR